MKTIARDGPTTFWQGAETRRAALRQDPSLRDRRIPGATRFFRNSMNAKTWYPTRRVLAWAFGAAALRVLIGGAVAADAYYFPEGHMVAAADLPTLVAYIILNIIGFHWDIINAFDIRFFVVGTVTWFILGYLVGIFNERQTHRRKKS